MLPVIITIIIIIMHYKVAYALCPILVFVLLKILLYIYIRIDFIQ